MATHKGDLESWHKDKAVQDNITESWLCADCGVNTCPGSPDGPQTRIDLALHGESSVHMSREAEVYYVKREIWKRAGMRPWGGCLCIGCLERRIGRQLRPRDFDKRGDTVWAGMPCTERLLNRRGLATATVQTADGPMQVICDIEVAPLIDGGFAEPAPV